MSKATRYRIVALTVYPVAAFLCVAALGNWRRGLLLFLALILFGWANNLENNL